MHPHFLRAAVGITAALVLGTAVDSASASRGIGQSTGGRAVTFTSEQLTFELEAGRVSCPVTLTGTMLSGFRKSEWAPTSEITSASLGSCTGGSARLLTETLPWFGSYYSFAGTLPRITSLNVGILELAALVEVFGIGCLFRGIVRGSTGPSSEITEIRLSETVAVPIATRLSALCPSEGRVYGSFRVSPTIRLSLLESLPAASTIEVRPNPLIISNIKTSGTVTITAVGGTVTLGAEPSGIADPGFPRFNVSGCRRVTLNNGQSCTVTVTVGASRPSRGDLHIMYVDSNDDGDGVVTSVRIE